MVTGSKEGSPLYKPRDASVDTKNSTGTFSGTRSHVTDPQVKNCLRIEKQGRTVEPYPQFPISHGGEMKQLAVETVSATDYLHSRAGHRESGWPSSISSYESSIAQSRSVEGFPRHEEISILGTNDGLSLRSQSANRFGGIYEPLQQAHQSHMRSLSTVSDSGVSSGHTHLNYGGHRSNSINTHSTRTGNLGSRAAPSKLRWEARDVKGTDPADASAPSSLGAAEEEATTVKEDDPTPLLDFAKLGMSDKETSSLEYVGDRNLKTIGSRRQSPEDRRLTGEGTADLIMRTPSEGSEKTFDMYDNAASIGEYEQSETSSTTIEEMDNSEGNGQPRRHSGEMGQYSPPRDQSRPNVLRSDIPSGRIVFSEESSSYGSQTEMTSPDNHLDNAKQVAVRDNIPSRMGSTASNGGFMTRPFSVRRKSPSHDYGSDKTELLHRLSSDPGGGSRGEQVIVNHVPLYDSSKSQPQLPHSQQNFPPPWNRYMPPMQGPPMSSRTYQQWSPSASPGSYFGSPSHHPSPTKSTFAPRQMPGQLPTRHGHPPPLPPPGTLRRVLCQHCETLLLVPDKLPPPNSSIQKLRCGACRNISLFSVPYVEDANAAPVPYFTRSDPPLGQSLLASSPDFQAELISSLGNDNLQKSGRTSSEKHGHVPLPKVHSPGSEDLIAAERDIREQAFPHRADHLHDVHRSNSSPEFLLKSSGSLSGSTVPLYKGRSAGFDIRSQEVDPKTEMAAHRGPPIVAGNVATEEKRIQEVTSSDSEAESSSQRTSSITGSPQLNNGSCRSSPYPNSGHESLASTLSNEHSSNNEQLQDERRLTKAFRGIIGIRKTVLEMTKSGRHSSSTGHFQRKVVVNGVAIPDHLVKKAEDQAGPIHPGSYWYDTQAGFWGVSGGQCLGIIPPFIDEFNYPLSRDCSGGKTGVLVNGRELHHADLRKLSQRGLPDTPGMSYRIEIDGRVVEDALGSELRSLGRLAPSVEQKGRGVGMYVPANP